MAALLGCRVCQGIPGIPCGSATANKKFDTAESCPFLPEVRILSLSFLFLRNKVETSETRSSSHGSKDSEKRVSIGGMWIATYLQSKNNHHKYMSMDQVSRIRTNTSGSRRRTILVFLQRTRELVCVPLPVLIYMLRSAVAGNPQLVHHLIHAMNLIN